MKSTTHFSKSLLGSCDDGTELGTLSAYPSKSQIEIKKSGKSIYFLILKPQTIFLLEISILHPGLTVISGCIADTHI